MAASERDRTQRRVYVLPTELVDRVTAYQEKMGLPSEVEAARRLLDEALKHRDEPEDIIRRFAQYMKETRVLSDIAKEVLVGHPKVTSLQFDGGSLSVKMSDGQEITFLNGGGGKLSRKSGFGNNVTSTEFDKHGILDDEIPF